MKSPAETYERLRECDRFSAISRLTSALSHALGTPLNVISGRASMIAAGMLSDDEIQKSAATIVNQAQHVIQIIRQFVDFSRSRDLAPCELAVGELVGEAIRLVEPIGDDLRLVVQVDPALVAVVDRDRVLQLLTAQLVEGMRVLPAGSTVTISAQLERVASPADKRCAPGRYLRLAVEDDGPPRDDLAHVMDPIERPRPDGSSVSDANEVIGLGLYVCHAVVREHGGWLDVTSGPERGTRFVSYLPQGGKR